MSTGSIPKKLEIGVVHANWERSLAGGPTADLPGSTNTKGIRIVVDGRIDNALELARILGDREPEIASLLIEGYLAWGDALASKLSGDFAFVLWDERRRRLLAARDPFGVRPLFYRRSGAELWLAGSIASLRPAIDAGAALDDRRIAEYLLGVNVIADATFYHQVHELPAGTLLAADSQEVTVSRHWVPPVRASRMTMGPVEFKEEFGRLFVESVRERLQSDSPVVVHISGGLDSSSIAGATDWLSRHGRLPATQVRGAAALHPGLSCDESAFIDAVANRISFPVERWDATASPSPDLDLSAPSPLQPGLRALHRGGTTGDLSIAKELSGSAILTGTGGDELGTVFGFVPDLIASHRWVAAARELLLFPGATMRSRLARLRLVAKQYLPPRKESWANRARDLIPSWATLALRHAAGEVLGQHHLPEGRLHSHLATNVWRRLSSVRLGRVVTLFQEHARDYGIEYRFPFLDRELVTFVLNSGVDHWPRPHGHARLHRSALSHLLPAEVANRQGKAEFTPALASRILRARTEIDRILTQGPWYSERYVLRGEAVILWRRLSSGPVSPIASDWLALWSLVTLEAWLRRVFGYTSGALEAY